MKVYFDTDSKKSMEVHATMDEIKKNAIPKLVEQSKRIGNSLIKCI